MIDIDNQKNDGINTIPILSGNCFLCVFSIILNIIEIKIILSLKFLHSILYRLLFLISISEIINCFLHIIQSIIIMFDIQIPSIYIIIGLIIYFTDTLSLVLLACLCDSMNTMILKQNRQISSNQTYKYFSLIVACLLTIFYTIFIFPNIKEEKNYIYSNLISWKFISNEEVPQFRLFSFEFASYFVTIIIYFLIIVYSFVLILKIRLFIKEKSQDESKPKSWAKLNEFIIKMIKYPLYGALWVLPLIIYSLIEICNRSKEKINTLKIKYLFYFIFTFISSIRGVLFFKLFISNEKIKKFIQNKIQNIIFFQNLINDDISKFLDENKNSITRNTIELSNSKSSLLQEYEERDMKINNNIDSSNDKNEDSSDCDDDNSVRSRSKENNNNKSLSGNNKNEDKNDED